MHDYSLAGHPKEKIFFVLAFLAIVVTPWVANLLTPLVNEVLGDAFPRLHALVKAVPISAVFFCIYLTFDKWLWKFRFFRWLFLYPDINGTWECTGRTIKKNGEDALYDWKATIIIRQSWSKILITLDRPGSSASVSVSASIYNHKAIGPRLLYQYENQTKLGPVDQDMRNHVGTADITFNPDGVTAEGSYYTDHHRGTVGTIDLRRMST